MLLIVFYCFVAVTAINVCYYFSFYSFLFSKPNSHLQAKVTTPISVIICAKNEAENLRENLPKILAQKYFEFELILINFLRRYVRGDRRFSASRFSNCSRECAKQ